MTIKHSIKKLVGCGYVRGWYTNCHCRYRVFKGARNTKKSYVLIGLEVLVKIISNPLRNVLILRKNLNSNRLSTFSTLKMLITLLQLDGYFHINNSLMQITYIPTGQLIVFGGMSDVEKLTSMRMPKGYLTDVYIEEAFELDDYDAWRKVDGTIRGKLPDGLFHQITFCFNAWNREHWLYHHFFEGRLEDDLDYLMTHKYMDWCDEDLVLDYGKGLYLHISTYKINEFRDTEIYDVAMEELKRVAPEIYKVEALGMWGNSTETTYPEFSDELIKTRQYINNLQYNCYCIGIDTGLSNGEGKVKKGEDVKVRSATTMQMVGITADFNKLCAIDEYWYSNEQEIVKKTEPQIMEEIIDTLIKWRELYRMHPVLMKGVIPVYVDCADVGFRQGLELLAKKKGLFNVSFVGSTKIRIQTRVDFSRVIMAFGDCLYSEACKNLIRETKHSRKGKSGEPREDINDHALNSWEYAWQPVINKLKRWKTFKQH